MLIRRRRPYLVVFSTLTSFSLEIYPIYFHAYNNRDARRKVNNKLREQSCYSTGKLYKLKRKEDKFIGSIKKDRNGYFC